MEDQANPDKAIAKKDILQQNATYKIIETKELAGLLQDARGFAKSHTEQTGLSDQEIQELYLNSLESENEDVRNAWSDLAKDEKIIQSEEEKIKRVVDTQAYRMFLNKFYTLWLNTEHNIAAEFWEKGKQKEISAFFKGTSEGNHDPRKALELFLSFSQSLYNCGLTNFQYKTINEKESYDNEYFKILIDAKKKKRGGKRGGKAKK